MSDQLPHTDPDLQLARAINRARLEGTRLSELKDPLVPPLLEHRQQLRQRIQVDQAARHEVWQQVAEATSPSTDRGSVYRLFTAKSFRWAAAAAVLIGLLFSVLYIQFWQQPELLAQSGTTIKTIRLSDGSTVTLRPHSQLLAVEQTEATLLYELEGEALFEVRPKQQRTFSVQTDAGRVSVLGTRFMLSSWGNRTQVYLEEGSISLQPLQKDSTLILQPGEAASIGRDDDITHTFQADARTFTDWLDQQLIFESKPAIQVVHELEQEFDISITLPDTVQNNRLSGQLSLESLQVSLNDLTLVLGGTFVRTGERSYRFEAR
ncbi:MAG TPA: FecR domain-containing protein [Fodinibius sp.]|nr:FecR domain-containing protein [Fodinibius sp.]